MISDSIITSLKAIYGILHLMVRFFQANKHSKDVLPATTLSVCGLKDFYDLTDKMQKRMQEPDTKLIERIASKKYESRIGLLIDKLKLKRPKEILRSDFTFLVEGIVNQKYRTPYFRTH